MEKIKNLLKEFDSFEDPLRIEKQILVEIKESLSVSAQEDIPLLIYVNEYQYIIKRAGYHIIKGEKEGWKLLEQSFFWKFEAIKYLGKVDGVLLPGYWGQALGLAICFGHLNLAIQIAESIIEYCNHEDSKEDLEIPFDSTHSFFLIKMLEFLTPWKGIAQINKKINYGVYKPLVQNIDKQELRVRDLEKICDYHLTQTFLDEELDSPEFESLDSIPYEINCIKIIREWLSLPLPKFSHPILNTPLANFPKGPQGYKFEEDTILKAILDACPKK